ncbi:MAG: hypothetical protein QWI73_03195 [Alphaproteobacteria bacterium]|nr:hypothetical protein [Alphaproteobacteria bacterium]
MFVFITKNREKLILKLDLKKTTAIRQTIYCIDYTLTAHFEQKTKMSSSIKSFFGQAVDRILFCCTKNNDEDADNSDTETLHNIEEIDCLLLNTNQATTTWTLLDQPSATSFSVWGCLVWVCKLCPVSSDGLDDSFSE